MSSRSRTSSSTSSVVRQSDERVAAQDAVVLQDSAQLHVESLDAEILGDGFAFLRETVGEAQALNRAALGFVRSQSGNQSVETARYLIRALTIGCLGVAAVFLLRGY